MEAALLVRRFLPPPAAFALVLAGEDSPGARLAAQRDEAALVQRIEGHPQGADRQPHIVAAAVGQRVPLDQRPALQAGELAVDLAAARTTMPFLPWREFAARKRRPESALTEAVWADPVAAAEP